MSEQIGDFNYNGIPFFKVGFSDFSYIYECINSDNRMLSKNIQSIQLQEQYKKSKTKAFGVVYEGVMIDFRDLKKD